MEQSNDLRAPCYTVQLDNFEGPLDLLLYLIQRNEMDVFTVSLSKLAEDFLRCLAQMSNVDLDEAGEFLVLASTLILFKARQLLPSPPQEEEDQYYDPDAERKRLEEFERYRKVAELLKEYEVKWSSVHGRHGTAGEKRGETVWELEDISIFDLYQAFQKVLDELGAERPAVVFGEDYTVDEKMVELRILLAHVEMFSLTQYLVQLRSRAEIIVTFLALLELVRLQQLNVKQSKMHAEIWIVRGPQYQADAEMDADEESKQ